MKLFNKERRLRYLGFDDKWFVVIGIIVLSFVMDFIFTNSFGRGLPYLEAIIGWSISLFFSTINWFAIREVMIRLRKRFPNFSDDFKRISLFLFAIISSVLVIDWIGTAIFKSIFGISFHEIPASKLISIIIVSTMTMATYEAIYHNVRLRKSIREEEQAKQAIIEAKLDALRNQAQPHFLFNTLNTLRDIIDQNTKIEAKEFVDKIADVYRFILESNNANLVPLRNELKFCQSYMHIQSERFGENLKVNWQIDDSKKDLFIVPMSLQLLLENAIKHNVISNSKPLLITVSSSDDEIQVSNKIQPKSSKLHSTKLGLKNIQKRYGLISDRAMAVDNNGESFTVTLPLLKSSHKKQSYANRNN